MKKTIIIFTFLSFLAKIIAFGRELVLAYFFGTSVASDVFLLSMTIPVTFFGMISTGIQFSFISSYADICKRKNQQEAVLFTNKVLHALFLFGIGIIIFYYIFSEPLIRIFASGFTEESSGLAVRFTNISIWVVIFSCMTSVFTAYLQINNGMQITAFVSIPLNIGIIASIIIAFYIKEMIVLPIGYVVANVVQVSYLLIFVIRKGYWYRFGTDLHHKYVKKFFRNIAMLSIAGSIQQINMIIDRTLATKIAVGGLSVFEYGSRINDFIMGISIIPISVAIYPELVKHADHTYLLKKKIKEGMLLFTGLMIPLTVIVTEFSEPIVTMLYGRGAFSHASIVYTSEVVFYYSIGLLAFALRELMVKIFYVVTDVKTPMVNTAVGVVINIILNYILSEKMGLGGLALATSVSAVITVILLYRAAVKIFGKFELKKEITKILFICVAAAGAAVSAHIAYGSMNYVISSVWVCFGIACICFGIFYVCVLIKLGVLDLRSYIRQKEEKCGRR